MPDQRPLKGVHNPDTGANDVVPVTDAEWDEIKARQVSAEAQAASTEAEAASEQVTLKALPTADEISAAKTTDLKDMMLRQNAVLRLVLKRLGLDG